VSSFIGGVLALTLLLQCAFAQSIASDSEIRKTLVDRIDTYHRNVGIVVGVIEPQGRRIVAYGRIDKSDPRPVNGDTIFEIDSVTKVFTGLLLADMVQRGEVSLSDPVAKYLPPGVKLPERRGRQINLLDLATHTSGLTSFPSNINPTYIPGIRPIHSRTIRPTNSTITSQSISSNAISVPDTITQTWGTGFWGRHSPGAPV
jgi:CubicO group peptidase (beta-lactamase class C family)